MPAFGVKTNERPGTRAVVRHVRMSAYKVREVLDLIRGKEVQQADEILQFCERDAAIVVRKCLQSAMANAENNDQIDSTELFVSACYADEGPTLKRWRPRARGRATRIRKRTCHITIIVARLSEEELQRRRDREAVSAAAAGRGRRRSQAAADSRRQRVAKSRARQEATEAEHDHDHDHEDAETVEPADTLDVEAGTTPDEASVSSSGEGSASDEPHARSSDPEGTEIVSEPGEEE